MSRWELSWSLFVWTTEDIPWCWVAQCNYQCQHVIQGGMCRTHNNITTIKVSAKFCGTQYDIYSLLLDENSCRPLPHLCLRSVSDTYTVLNVKCLLQLLWNLPRNFVDIPKWYPHNHTVTTSRGQQQCFAKPALWCSLWSWYPDIFLSPWLTLAVSKSRQSPAEGMVQVRLSCHTPPWILKQLLL